MLLHCPHYTNYHKDLLNHISNITDRYLDSLTLIDLCNLLLYIDSQFPFDMNHSTIELTITFIKSTECFEQIQLYFLQKYLSPQSNVFTPFPQFYFCIVNIRAVCYFEQQRLDTLCHFSVALDTDKFAISNMINLP